MPSQDSQPRPITRRQLQKLVFSHGFRRLSFFVHLMILHRALNADFRFKFIGFMAFVLPTLHETRTNGEGNNYGFSEISYGVMAQFLLNLEKVTKKFEREEPETVQLAIRYLDDDYEAGAPWDGWEEGTKDFEHWAKIVRAESNEEEWKDWVDDQWEILNGGWEERKENRGSNSGESKSHQSKSRSNHHEHRDQHERPRQQKTHEEEEDDDKY